MPDPSKWIASAMVGITIVVIIVGAIVLKTMLAEPVSPVCDHLKQLQGGEKVVEGLQRYLASHGRTTPDSCRAIVKAVDDEMDDGQFGRLTQCLTKATTADAGSECIVTVGGGLQR